MKAIQLLIESQLPPDLRNDKRLYDKDGIGNLLAEVATKYPDKYSDIVQHISDVGRKAAYFQGETITLDDLRPTFDKDVVLAQMDKELDLARLSSKTPAEFQDSRMNIWAKYADDLEKQTISSALASGNNIGKSVMSGSRGNTLQMRAMITTPSLYTDYKDNPIPLFVRKSFGQGLRPAEYLASSYGVRKAVIATKISTASGGDLLKQWTSATAGLTVTEDDCGTSNGVELPLDDTRNLTGRVLPKSYGDVKDGSVIDKHVLKQLRQGKQKSILVRSPMTCQAKTGICSKCLGTLPGGKFAPRGYAAGLTAAAAIGEPITQSALNVKHGGGSFKGTKKVFSGFDVVNQLVQSPETFPDKAAVSETAGRVDSIEAAPQGGNFIKVNGLSHYALPGYEPTVKPGDEVEAGDQLSDGIVDVFDVIKHRGLGEGRQYYVNRLGQALEESGLGKSHRMNLELLARASLDHVRVDNPEGLGGYLPDDIVSYNGLVSKYSPPASTKLVSPDQGVGKYLETPTMHFTVGTKLTPRMVKQIREAGVENVGVSDQEPRFVPEMVRLRAAPHSNPDWLARMHSSYQTTGLQDSAQRARDTDTESNTHFVPRLAKGLDFGKKVEQTGKF